MCKIYLKLLILPVSFFVTFANKKKDNFKRTLSYNFFYRDSKLLDNNLKTISYYLVLKTLNLVIITKLSLNVFQKQSNKYFSLQ